MEGNAKNDLYCKVCLLEFDSKAVYDSHLSKYHKIAPWEILHNPSEVWEHPCVT